MEIKKAKNQRMLLYFRQSKRKPLILLIFKNWEDDTLKYDQSVLNTFVWCSLVIFLVVFIDGISVFHLLVTSYAIYYDIIRSKKTILY